MPVTFFSLYYDIINLKKLFHIKNFYEENYNHIDRIPIFAVKQNTIIY